MQEIYSQIFRIRDVYPVGALSEGPAGRETHDRNLHFFKFKPQEQWTHQFNTDKVVFYDKGDDFVIQESTIFGQASVLLFLAALDAVYSPAEQKKSKKGTGKFLTPRGSSNLHSFFNKFSNTFQAPFN
ncbi:MAG: hypothetical protein GTO45_35860 [Candidatus Aminicenantes bacterium]|nr:hypothetical protein [Candidatus Aminicenantes bacterium]NIM84066.1 hypothetical protein [Candidatus Aminicenantes bacterium]NIN23528.1 hypothetical protein [Candidatus Aminicenantes bacterium]NIN47233.1 hypothetical protein [Candidatus Aminicenantes bacterium]NIN90160.1 hypothetical protein [Candidatus Aminicenantes bacterium]